MCSEKRVSVRKRKREESGERRRERRGEKKDNIHLLNLNQKINYFTATHAHLHTTHEVEE